MNISANDRRRLHVRLEQVLGPEDGATLMELLPSGGRSDVASQRDLLELKAEVRAFQREVRASTRVLFFSILASQATLVGMVIAAVKL